MCPQTFFGVIKIQTFRQTKHIYIIKMNKINTVFLFEINLSFMFSVFLVDEEEDSNTAVLVLALLLTFLLLGILIYILIINRR